MLKLKVIWMFLVVVCLLINSVLVCSNANNAKSRTDDANTNHLVVNEVSGNSQELWIEVYNPTNRTINLTMLTFYDVDSINILPPSLTPLPFGPFEYMIFCKNISNLTTKWDIPNGIQIIELDDCRGNASVGISSEGGDTDYLWVEGISFFPSIDTNHSWSRYKGGYDTDNFTNDFYDEPNPTPGKENNRAKYINHSPTISPIPTQNATVNTTFSYQVNVTDVDGDNLTYSTNIGIMINTTGFLSFIPNATGTYNITITVNDTKSETNITFILIVNAMLVTPINHLPSISPISIQNVTVNTTFSLQINATDTDSDNLTYNASIGTINVTGYFTFTPTTTGTYNITIAVNDSKAQNSTTFVLVVNATPVTPVNHVPTITSITANCTTANISEQITITVTASDIDGNNLTYSYATTGGDVSSNGSTVVWTAPTIAGNYTITVTVSDGNLTANSIINITVTNNASSTNNPPDKKQNGFIPGFELILIACSLGVVVVLTRRRR